MFFGEQRNLHLSNFVFTSNSFNDNMIPGPEGAQYSKSVLPEDNIGNSNSDFSCTTIEKNKQVYKRKLFTEEEDNLLKKAALTYQNVSWNDIAKFVPGRTPKQCRDRWVNYLQPSLKNSPFSEDEDRLLFFLVSIYGTHWSKMKSHFPTRSTNSIKNRWYWFNKRTTKKLTNLSNDLIQMQNSSKNDEKSNYLIDNNPKQMCLINCKSLDNKDQKNSEVASIINDKCQGNLDSKLVNQNDNAKLSKPVNNNIIFDDELIKLSIDELDW